MTAGELATATGLRRGTIAPELSKLVKTGELVKADRGYKTAAPANSTTSTATANSADKSPAVLALGRELDAGLAPAPEPRVAAAGDGSLEAVPV